jgi:hypothetical protein
MGRPVTTTTFAQVLDGLVARALRDDIPPLVAERARLATARALRLGDGASAPLPVQRRAEAYFSACLRRATVRGGAGARATARLVAAAVVQDLLEAGRDGAGVWRELERGWSERLPTDLLEEYRLRLCG